MEYAHKSSHFYSSQLHILEESPVDRHTTHIVIEQSHLNTSIYRSHKRITHAPSQHIVSKYKILYMNKLLCVIDVIPMAI